jgi:hypothetical protein
MSMCALCAQPTLGPGEFCSYHTAGQSDDWATGNRLMCDFFHRGLVPATPGDAERSVDRLLESLEIALTAEVALTT